MCSGREHCSHPRASRSQEHSPSPKGGSHGRQGGEAEEEEEEEEEEDDDDDIEPAQAAVTKRRSKKCIMKMHDGEPMQQVLCFPFFFLFLLFC